MFLSLSGHTGRLLKSLCFTSIAFLLLHIIYQVTVNTLLAGDNLEPNFNCSTWEKSVRQLGMESVRGADAGNGIRVFIPDIGMFVAGLVTWLLCLSLEEKQQVKDTSQQHNEEEEKREEVDLEEDDLVFEEDFEHGDGEMTGDEEESTKMMILRQIAAVASKVKEIIGNLITTAGKVVVTILLGLTGIMLPSLTSAVYFFTFLGLCTWWSFCRTFHPLIFSCLCVLMAIFSAGHLVVLYLYQFQLFQELIPPGDSYASLFGISSVVQTDCSYTWMFRVNPALAWYHYVNPIMLLVLYYTLATLIRLWLQDPTDMVSSSYCNTVAILGQGPGLTSNGSRPDYVPTSGPLGLDQYSTPQYKPDQPGPDLERKDSSVYEVAGVCGEGSDEETAGGAMATAPEEEGGSPRANAAVTTFRFIMKQSYICALIAMMAWSITYVSWLTFVFLIWSCTLWMVRDRRKYAMITSPFMVFYGNLLIILQYIWSFELLQPVPGLFLKKEVPFRELGSKMLCLLSFWLLLRQALTERKESQREEEVLLDIRVIHAHKNGESVTLPSPVFPTEKEEEVDEGSGHREMMELLGNTLTAMLNKYWIYICAGMFFFVSFQGRIVMYKIIYMMLLLFCVACYQVHYEWWRRMLKYFWMSVVFYTMMVLILVYTFQFDSSIHVWSNMTGMSKDKLEDLGLEKFSVPALFMRIFIPTSFLLVCILHLHYFHQHFLLLTDIKTVADKQKSTITRLVHLDGSLADISLIKPTLTVTTKEEEAGEKVQLEEEEEKEENRRYEDEEEMGRYEEPQEHCNLRSKWYLVVDRLTVLFLKFLQYFQQLQLTVWWLLELHIIKIVSSYILWVSIKEVSLFNYVFLVSWAFALPFSQFRPLASSVCTVWTCVIIVCKMLYQLTSINPSTYSNNCSMPLNYTDAQRSEMAHSLLYSAPVDPANWVGLRKFSPLLENLRNNLLILALLAFEVTIYRHQDLYRMRNNLTTPVTRTIFHDITRQHLDDGILNCAKYFINYFFYKFGLETCFLLAVNVIGQRMDFYAMLHAFGLIAVIYRRRRKAIAEIWPKYSCFLACMLTFQYFVCIGFPPAACKDYPWRFPSSSTDSNVIKWLYFPDFHTKPNPLFLLYDFMLLLCASLQRQVFEEENEAAVRLLAGDNVEICRDLDAASFSQHNPVPDFIHCRSYLDMLKVIMFSYLFWFVLTIIFITGTTRISIFCMGYLVACFYFLLFGGDLLLKPIKSILHYWDFLIAYNVFVITMKNILSILACGYIKVLVTDHCWLIQLFSLACTIKAEQHTHKQCELPSDEAGIIWDSICFAFLLLQRRVFMSYYFLHVVADIRSSQILASRGAELFQATIVKAVKARIEVEKKSMDLLKRQMDRIKSRQQKFKRGKERMLSLVQESGDVEDEEEDDEENTDKEKSRGKTKKQWWRPWVDHASMVRSGNYYLFETDSEEEEEEEDKKEEEPPKKSAFQFYCKSQRIKTDVDLAIKRRVLSSSPSTDNILKRVFNIVKFSWVLFLAMLDSFTAWINSMCQEHLDISTVLRIERCMLTHEVKKGNKPSRESIHVYYRKQMCKAASIESGLERTEEETCQDCIPHKAERQSCAYLESQDPMVSHDSLSSEHTQCTIPSTSMGLYLDHEESLYQADLSSTIPTDTDIPPSYSRATGLDREGAEQVSSSRTHHGKRLVVVTPDEKSDFLSGVTSTTFPSLTHELTASDLLRNRMFYDEELEDSERFYGNQPALLQLLYALYNMLVAHSEMVCFLVIILNHMISASVATLVLPILIFLWAMLSVPRPSKLDYPFNYIHTGVITILFLALDLQCHGLWDEDDPRGGGGETPKQHHDDRQKRSSSRRAEKQALGGSSSLLESVRARFPRRFHSLSTSTQLRRKSSSAASHLSQRTLRSGHSRGDSVSSRQSLRRGDSVRSVQQRSKKEKILDKLREQLIKAKSFIVKKTLEIYIPIRQFFYNLIHPEYSAVTDVYVLMFLADTVDFIIIVFGFWAFGKHSAAADITSSLSEDQVPEAFLVMVLIQFGTMIIDRALYLRKTVMGKVIFQVILVFGIHFWMFFILPGVTERRFSKNTVAQLWYFVKCIYFGLSAYQIRCGYPTRVLGNFLTKSYNYLNLFLFQGFRLVPFLTELRAVMDWVWTDTTLSLSSWICVEDIYAHIFVLKCWRMSEKRYPQPRGQKKKKVVKYGMGGLIVMLLICIVWFPLLFMSLVKSVAGVVNKPLDVSVTITLGGFQPIFTMSAQQNQLKDISKSAMQFLEAYTSEDVTVAELEGSSNSLWTISPPSRKNLMDVLSKEEYFPVTMSWTIQRNLSLGAKAEVATDKHVTYLDMTTRQESRTASLNVTSLSLLSRVIAQVFPCFLRAPSDSNAKPIEQLHKGNNILLDLERTHNSSGEIQEWWIVDQPSAGQIQMRGAAVGKKREAGLQLYVFSDKVSPPSLGFLAGYGIMGLYASVVLVIGKFVREFFSGISHSIMFEELPAVDRILKLCTDIFLVRETGELELEEDLYAKLIFLYRSPETMIKWTRDQKTK
uniref:Piezo-type mechanosensitive ion channel component 2-like n=1 Tax=Salmo trutta TaxID=8032 RepID=A0A674D6W3_SALTR